MLEELKSNLFVFYSPNEGSNAYLLVGKKVVLVDASSENNPKELLQSLERVGFKAEEIDEILFTHGHADHFSGARPFKKASLKMHRLDADYVNSKDPMYTAATLLGSSFFPKVGFLEVEETIEFKPFKLRVLHTPGHTRGSVCFFDEKQKLLFSGDTLFKSACGRFDLLSGNKQELLKSISSLKELEFELLLPGHGLIVKEHQMENIKEALKTLSYEFV